MNKKGLTLVETVIALAILAVTSIAIVYVFTGGLKLFTKAVTLQRGQNVAKEYAESKLAGGQQTSETTSFYINGIEFTVNKITVTDPDSKVGYSYYDQP